MSTFAPLPYREGEDCPLYCRTYKGKVPPLQGKFGQSARFCGRSAQCSDNEIQAALIKQSFNNYFDHCTDHRVYIDLIMLLDKLHSRQTTG